MSFKLNGVASLTPVRSSPTLAELSIVTQLESGHGFTAPAPSPVANVDDTAIYLFGSQSLRLPSQGGGVAQIARKTGLTAIDTTGKYFRVYFMVDVPVNIANLRFDISSDNFVNWSRGLLISSQSVNAANPMLAPNVWYGLTIPTDIFVVGGGAGATMTAITALQFYIVDDGTGVHINVWLDKIATVAQPAVALITWTFDDGFLGMFVKGKPILDAADWRATWAPIIDKMGTNANYMTLAQNQVLFNSGWDAAVHAYTSAAHTNYDTMPDTAAIADTLVAKQWMRANGFGPADNFLIPHGALTSAARDAAYAANFTAVRTTQPSVRETYVPGRWFNLKCYNPGSKTVPTVEGIIDTVVTNKEWLIFQCHNVADAADGDINTLLTADLQTYVTYIQGKGAAVKVKSIAEVLATGTN